MPPLRPGHRTSRTTLVLALLLGLLPACRLQAQCTGSLDLGPDISVCTGSPATLTAPSGYASYLWEDGSTAQSRTVNSAGTYSCTVTAFNAAQDLVVNGNFNAGYSGFTSDYALGTGGTWGPLSNEGTYAVSNSPFSQHSNFIDCNDHTTGSGNMLVVNGAQTPDISIWCQTIAVQPNTDYAFGAWLCSVTSTFPAVLEFNINGVSVGSPLTASFATCNWQQFNAVWNSGASTTATICITNQNTQQSGNDFALDDISFSPMCVYTDDIAVIALPYPQPDLGPDQQLCIGTPLTLDPHWPAADSYAWSNGASSATLAPATSGTYWVDVTESGCTTRDSVDVLFKPLPTVNFGADQERCAGETALLNATNAGATYTWQDGSSAPTFNVTGSGTYDVLVDLNGCTATDTIAFTYHPLPVVSLGADTVICADSPYTIDVTRPGGSYVWDNGSTAATRTIDTRQWYWVDVTESICTTRDSLFVGIRALPVVDLRPDFLLCVGTTATLDAFGPDYTYLWNDGSTDSVLVVDGPGRVSVTVTNSCGSAKDSLIVTQGFCDCPVFVPNSFTPDGDGINDTFLPQFDCPVDLYTLRIYDRWGRVIWSTKDPGLPWDGADGITGVFTWTLEIRTLTVQDNKTREYRGHVVLLR